MKHNEMVRKGIEHACIKQQADKLSTYPVVLLTSQEHIQNLTNIINMKVCEYMSMFINQSRQYG